MRHLSDSRGFQEPHCGIVSPLESSLVCLNSLAKDFGDLAWLSNLAQF